MGNSRAKIKENGIVHVEMNCGLFKIFKFIIAVNVLDLKKKLTKRDDDFWSRFQILLEIKTNILVILSSLK